MFLCGGARASVRTVAASSGSEMTSVGTQRHGSVTALLYGPTLDKCTTCLYGWRAGLGQGGRCGCAGGGGAWRPRQNTQLLGYCRLLLTSHRRRRAHPPACSSAFPALRNHLDKTQILAAKTSFPDRPRLERFPLPQERNLCYHSLAFFPSYLPPVGASRRGELILTLGDFHFLGREASLWAMPMMGLVSGARRRATSNASA